MTEAKRPTSPRKLGPSGRTLWNRLTGKYTFDLRELAVLETACAQLDMVVDLERVLKAEGVIVVGSKGQPRLNAVVTEVRQCRLAFSRLLGELQLPSEDDVRAASWRSAQAKKAANTRWDHQRALDERRARIMAKEMGDDDGDVEIA